MLRILRFICMFALVTGCATSNTVSLPVTEKSTLIKNAKKQYVNELSYEIAVFDEVAFGLGLPLRQYLKETRNVKGKTVLDLGAGTGVLALIALKSGATKAIATDINPNAVANAIHNAELLGLENQMDVRLVSMDNPGAYSVMGKNEKFDLIISNPPQRKHEPKTIYEYSYKDLNLSFLRSIIEGLRDHLTPDGRGVFALYDEALVLTQQLAGEYGLDVNIYLKTTNRFGNYYVVEISNRKRQVLPERGPNSPELNPSGI
jgi:methylase of polypeptide subunit release factors